MAKRKKKVVKRGARTGRTSASTPSEANKPKKKEKTPLEERCKKLRHLLSVIGKQVGEVEEETSVKLGTTPKLMHVAGGKDRDPRGWTISLAFMTHVHFSTEAKASDDAIEIGWFDISDLPPMAFDHQRILSDVLFEIRRR